MQCIADRDYTVNREKNRHPWGEGDIRSLSCAYCTFSVLKRSTPQPKTSSSGLGRYNRMRGRMVAHLHECHRAELEAAAQETARAWAALEAQKAAIRVPLEAQEPDAGGIDSTPVRAICPHCRRRWYALAEDCKYGPLDRLTGAYLLDDLCSELEEPPASVEGRHEWFLYRAINHPAPQYAHLIGPDQFLRDSAALCGATGGARRGWIRVGADPMPNGAPLDPGETCPKCQAAYNGQ